jgi:hypothetical protein
MRLPSCDLWTAGSGPHGFGYRSVGVLSRDIRVSMYLGPHANRKSVLHLLSPAGQPVAFAKVAVNPLTRQLLRAERDALARLKQAELPGITVPEMLHYGGLQGLEILVMSALLAWLRRPPLPAPQLARAMATVARVDGVRTEAGARLGAPVSWLIPVLRREVSRL